MAGRNRTEQVNIALTPEERAHLEEAAGKARLPFSVFARVAALEEADRKLAQHEADRQRHPQAA